jgi:hypothetical protein
LYVINYRINYCIGNKIPNTVLIKNRVLRYVLSSVWPQAGLGGQLAEAVTAGLGRFKMGIVDEFE